MEESGFLFMAEIKKLVDFIEEKTDDLEGEIIKPTSVSNTLILDYIERRLGNLLEEKDCDFKNKLSSENEARFLGRLKKRLGYDR